jgi:hypothetical protein
MQNIDGNTYGFCLSVYSRGERNYSPLPSTVHCVVHRWNTDELKPSVCSKGEGNCSPSQTLFNMQYTVRNTDGLSHTVSVFQRRGELFPSSRQGVLFPRQGVLFPSPRHCLLCSTPMKTPKDSNLWCIPEVRGIVPILISMMAITKCQVPKRITDGMWISMPY